MKKQLLSIMSALFISGHAQAAWDKAPEFELSELKGSFNYQNIERVMEKSGTPFFDPTPDKRDDGLAVGTLPDKTKIMALAKEIADGKHAAYDSILIAHQDNLVFESYFNYGRINLPHYQASASKGYTAFAVGRAIQMGHLKMADLHKPVLTFLKGIDQDNLAEGAEKITLHHTLSMRSGLRISREKQDELVKIPELVEGQKLAQAYLTHSTPVTDESQIYHYQAIDTRITMLVLDAVLPGTAKEFIKTELLDKLGINRYYWEDNVSGAPESAFGTSMTSRDMLKWGLLLKNKGKWQGEQLISGSYLEEATGSVAIPTDDEWDYTGFRYGYYFWGKTLEVDGKKYNANMAWGGGTQMFIAVDDLDLVIAITARARSAGFQTLDMLEERVLPLFVSQG